MTQPAEVRRPTSGPLLPTAYLWVVAVISIVILGYVARHGQPFSSNLGLAAELVLLAVVAQHFPLEFGPQRKADASIAVYFACLLVFKLDSAVVLVGASQLLGQATLALRRAPGTGKRLRGPRGVLFNTSQLVIATALAGIVYALLVPHGGPGPLQRPESLWGLPLAAVVLHVVNSLSVAAMAAFQLRQSLLRTWLADWGSRAVERAGLLLIAVVTALAVGQYAWAPVLMALPVGILFLAQRRALELLAAEQSARADAVRAQQHLALLADASATLASSLDYQATVECAARLAVPALADCCAISINPTDEPWRNWAVAAIQSSDEDRLRQLLLRGSFPTRGEDTARSESQPFVSEDVFDTFAPDAESRRLVEELGIRSAAVVPLLARGLTLGTMIFLATASGRRYGLPELGVAEALARRIALAIDNARLYEEQQRIVTRLRQLRGQIEANERNRLLGDERERIARELHDRVEQTFFGIGLSVNAMLAEPETAPVASLRATLAQVHSSARQGADELRTAIFALTRGEVHHHGLTRALWQLVREFQERTELEADLVESGAERDLPREITEVLYAVAREGLANAEQHARATAVVVSLRYEPSVITLTVQDDGVGASALVLSALAHSATRFGLRGIRERVVRSGGEFSAKTGDDGGFVLRASVPLREPPTP